MFVYLLVCAPPPACRLLLFRACSGRVHQFDRVRRRNICNFIYATDTQRHGCRAGRLTTASRIM